MLHGNNKDADYHVHPHSLIINFVIHSPEKSETAQLVTSKELRALRGYLPPPPPPMKQKKKKVVFQLFLRIGLLEQWTKGKSQVLIRFLSLLW